MVETVKQSTSLTKLNGKTLRTDAVETNEDHYCPSVRILHIPKLKSGACGFHLTRSKWDPYPWVSGVDKESPAEITGLKVGDCVLEVNNEDVLGMRIAEVANMVRSKADIVSLLLWSTGMEPTCNPESLCCGPMPLNLERLSASMQTIVAALECPVCFDTIPPPVFQCQNGHLVCSKCRVRAEKCAICREKYTPGRSLLAEQVYHSLTEAFNLAEDNDGKLRERLFGAKCKRVRNKNSDNDIHSKPIHSHTHKFLAKIMGKATSVDNLSKKQISEVIGEFDGLKCKPMSLSTSEIYRPLDLDNSVSVLRCPSANRLAPELSSSYNSLTVRRPTSSVSCHASAESVNSIPENGIEIVVPDINCNEVCYLCPCGDYCDDKIKVSNLDKHINDVHKVPIISFGTSSAEISLPPRTPVDNACLVLILDNYKFWLKLITDTTSGGDLFLSCLMQGSAIDSKNYVLEVIIRKEGANKILGKELISRNEIYSMETQSWKEIITHKMGIFYSNESIKTTFDENSELVLKASVKRLADL